jgi:hypothetical protein
MLNFNDIQKLFGKPLSNFPIPRTPYQLKLWHAAAIGLVGYFAYKGIIYSIQEKSIRIRRKED